MLLHGLQSGLRKEGKAVVEGATRKRRHGTSNEQTSREHYGAVPAHSRWGPGLVLPKHRCNRDQLRQTDWKSAEAEYHKIDFSPPLAIPKCWGPTVITIPARMNVSSYSINDVAIKQHRACMKKAFSAETSACIRITANTA